MSLNRRRFIGSVAGASALSFLPSCQHNQESLDKPKVSLEELNKAAATPILQTQGIDSPVVIDSIALLKKNGEYFVHVQSKDGAEGISVTNSRAENLHPILNRRVIPYFIGKDARELDAHLFGVYKHSSNYKLQGLALWCPVSWVEFAILDMLGRISGKSIGELLGGIIRTKVPFYRASGHRDTTPEEEIDILTQMIEESGAKAIKFRVGGRMSRNADAMPGRTEGLITLARKTFGDSIDLHADSNSSYDPPEAIKVGRMLEDVKAIYFEEPCPFDHLEDTKTVTDRLTIPVSGGEQEFSQRRFRWMIQNRGVDIVQPDLQYYGGLIRSMRVARMADVAHMPTTVHISGGFGFIYMLHFSSAARDIGKFQEYKGSIDKYGPWFNPGLQLKDGSLTVPTGPGVGITDVPGVLKGAEQIV